MVARVCTGCKIEKPLEQYQKQTDGRLQPRCKACRSEYQAKQYAKSKDKAREYGLRRKYGIGIAEYEHMLLAQRGVCAICAEPEPVPGVRLAVDHDHATGSVRGLLCSLCNRTLGLMRDDPDLLRAAASYLEGKFW